RLATSPGDDFPSPAVTFQAPAGEVPGATPLVVLVSGSPGAGKTTLAVPLASALGFALPSKDLIKEVMHEALAIPAGDLAASRRIGSAAMEVLWAPAPLCHEVVLEANFRPHSQQELARIAFLQARVVEVHCQCPPWRQPGDTPSGRMGPAATGPIPPAA
ncbi:hypothetical protein B1A_20559, partial [mine drainage metagenome]